jgi:acyl dehydratase
MNTLFYEDIEVGAVYRSGGRTVTEADNTFFCMMSGDWNPIHANEAYARETRFRGRVVAGIFGITLILGAMNQWGIFEESAIAMLNIRDWTFKKPILLGTTITVAMHITNKRMTSNGKSGIIERRFDLLDENGELIQSGHSDMMIALRESV